MPGTVQRIINSPLGISLALSLGWLLPPKAGYRLASWVAGQVASRQDFELIQALRLNHYVIMGGKASAAELDRAARETLQHGARCLYDLYHLLKRPQAIRKIVQFEPQAAAAIDEFSQGKTAAIIVAVHTSNFDLAARALWLRLGSMVIRPMMIGFPNPGLGYQWQNWLRRSSGIYFLPASNATLRLASRHLSQGGVIFTGIDRPIPGLELQPRFFGRPAPLPMHHIMLALRAELPIHVAGVMMEPDGTYRVRILPTVPMVHLSDRKRELVRNAEAILETAEELIRCVPEQWTMYYPVWPSAASEMRASGLLAG